MKLFRERLLARLVERHAISQDLARKLVAWKHPGFSTHIADAIPFENKKAIEDLVCYIVRAPLLCGRPHRRGYADLAIMRSVVCCGAGFARRHSEMRAVVDGRWSA
jgi:hypothetical protein